MRIGFGLGPFYVSQRIGGRRRRRKSGASGASGASGCAVVLVTLGAVLVGFWPFMLGIHAWAWLIAIPWWAALALLYVLPKRRQALAQSRQKAAEAEALARIQARDRARQIAAQQAMQQAVETDLARLRQESVSPPGPPFYAQFVMQGKTYTCEHNHRTRTAAVECAKRMARAISRELGLEKPEFNLPGDNG